MNKLIVYVDICFLDRKCYPVFLDTNNTSEYMWKKTTDTTILTKLERYLQENNFVNMGCDVVNFGNVNVDVDLAKIIDGKCHILECYDSEGMCNVKVIYDDEIEEVIQNIHEDFQSLADFIGEEKGQRLVANVDVHKTPLKHGATHYAIFGQCTDSETGQIVHVEQANIIKNITIL
jgi:hypothetical protein